MTETSQLILCGKSVKPPEELDIEEHPSELVKTAILQSSQMDIIDNIGKSEFSNVYRELKNDIITYSFKKQRRFILRAIEKIEEVYDFTFPINLDINTKNDIKEFYDFLEFLEYNNIKYISNVWKFLDIDIMKVDIKKYCEENFNSVIKESERQIESHDLNELISTFLRTYMKERFIEWFVKVSIQSKIEIKLEQII
ncbi:MAG: hypothetical protein PVG65_01480 [Candidatus Thorarchaeota archaeon]|jgi:hypothetical protein